MSDLTPDRSRALLRELAGLMSAAGHTGRVLVVGGAAMAFMVDTRRSTTDIDCVILPQGAGDEAVRELTDKYGLDDGWINDAAKAFIPAVGLEDWNVVIEVDGTTVSIASPELLLAMKLFANRPTRDWDDIRYLLKVLDIGSVEQAQEIYERYHAQELIPETAVVRLEIWLRERSWADHDEDPSDRRS